MYDTPSTKWRDRALLARIAEQDAHHAANERVNAGGNDPYAAEYSRNLRAAKHVEADAHAQAAELYETAYQDALRHETVGAL